MDKRFYLGNMRFGIDVDTKTVTVCIPSGIYAGITTTERISYHEFYMKYFPRIVKGAYDGACYDRVRKGITRVMSVIESEYAFDRNISIQDARVILRVRALTGADV